MGTSKRYNSVPVKDNCALLAPTPIFSGPAIRWCHLNFSPADLCCHGNEFWDKTDYNSAPLWKIIAPCLHLPPLYAAARLYNVAMGQIPRSTERRPISSYWIRLLHLCFVFASSCKRVIINVLRQYYCWPTQLVCPLYVWVITINDSIV